MTDNLRTQIGKAIIKAYDEDPNVAGDYDPDLCYRAADEVIAVLMSRLTGQHFRAVFHPNIVGPARFVSNGEIYE